MTISMTFMMEDDLVVDQGQTDQGFNVNNNRERVEKTCRISKLTDEIFQIKLQQIKSLFFVELYGVLFETENFYSIIITTSSHQILLIETDLIHCWWMTFQIANFYKFFIFIFQ